MAHLIPFALAAALVAGHQDPDGSTYTSPDEALEAARSLEPGPERARAFAAALEVEGDVLRERLVEAHQAFLADAYAYRGESARTIAEAMYRRDPAVWSAFCLEGISRRLGDLAFADRVLAETYERAGPAQRPLILEARSLVALGGGDVDRARDHLGRAAARGRRGALQILGFLALSEGATARARRTFGALLEPHDPDPDDPTPWALRGWGMSLLPAPGPGGR